MIAVESGATDHALNNFLYFKQVAKKAEAHLKVAYGSRPLAIHKGKVLVMVGYQPILLKTFNAF